MVKGKGEKKPRVHGLELRNNRLNYTRVGQRGGAKNGSRRVEAEGKRGS